MNEFLLKYGGEIITGLITLTTSIIAAIKLRKKEKQALRKTGELKDSIYMSQNGLSKFHNPDKH